MDFPVKTLWGHGGNSLPRRYETPQMHVSLTLFLDCPISTKKTVGVSKKSKDVDVRNALVEWYEEHALERLTEKTNRYAGIMGVSPNSISVRDYKSRWGSCSSKGEISYNWRIIIAPHHIVDYVVVHELCHLKHLNHSPTYWRSVKTEIPDYDSCRQWLRIHEGELVI